MNLPLSTALALAVAGGLLHALVYPPWSLDMIAWAALTPILILLRLERCSVRGALLGGVFGLVSAVAATPWLFETLHQGFGVRRLVAAALCGVAYGHAALGFALFGALAVRLRGGLLPVALAGPLGWAAGELLQTRGLVDLPWLLYGHAQYQNLPLLQLAELGGVPLVGTALLLVNACLGEAALAARDRRRPLRWLAAAVALFAAVHVYGLARLATLDATGETVSVALIQASTPQAERWRPELRERNLARQLELTREAVAEGAELVIWSETAIDLPPAQDPTLAAALAAAQGEARLLAGVPLPAATDAFTNSLALFEDGETTASYAKVLLFPLAEREPRWLSDFPALHAALRPLTSGPPYSPGAGSEPLVSGALRAGPLICFEALFPDRARAAVEAGANLLVNVSNDAFFSSAWAAEQHFAGSAFRAVETRRTLVRVANRGIGAVVRPTGEVLLRVGREERSASLAGVAPSRGRTPFVRGGWTLPYVLAGIAALGLLPKRRRPGGRDIEGAG